jgi:hypothetical protein
MPFRHKEDRNEAEMWLTQKENQFGENNPNWQGGVELTCDNPKCNNKFWRLPSSLKKHKHFFCCSGCHDEFRRKPEDPNKLKAEDMRGENHGRWAGPKYCKTCGKELFERKARRRLYCSDECCANRSKRIYKKGKDHPQWMDVEIFCKWCGDEIVKRRHSKRVFCSMKCRDEWKTAEWSRENNPLWEGGSSYSEYPPEFNANLREEIRRRDNKLCQWCGEANHILDVHHIDRDKQNCEQDNLVTLCRPCHRRVHWELWRGHKPEFLNGMKTI